MSDKSRGLILIVEDNLHNRRIFHDVLLHCGFEVAEAENGEQALEQIQLRRPDLILMDLSLPVKDGWTTTKEIKEMKAFEQIPIIALTAHAMAGDEERAIEAGCDGYLSKPISPKKVVKEIEKRLSAK